MDVLRQDLRAAAAAMRRAPAVSLTAIVTLALGIGAALAVFATLHGVLLRPLPYANPDRLVRVWEERPGGASPAGNRWLSRGAYAGWQEHARTLDAPGGYAAFAGVAMMLAGIGLFGALSYSVSQRDRELGVRAAGADPLVALRK